MPWDRELGKGSGKKDLGQAPGTWNWKARDLDKNELDTGTGKRTEIKKEVGNSGLEQ